MDAEIIIILVVAVVIFFLCRGLNCWYFKINARVELLEQLVENQKEIIRLLKEDKNGENASVDSKFKVGQKVKLVAAKDDLPIDTIVRIDRIEGENLFCSYEMREVGPYNLSEVTSI